MTNSYSDITPYIRELAACSDRNNGIQPQMYIDHHVKRGLRDLEGRGVIAGLTEISDIQSTETKC